MPHPRDRSARPGSLWRVPSDDSDMTRALLPWSNGSSSRRVPARHRRPPCAAKARAAARLLGISQALALAGCASILGIDHDYGDRPDHESKPGVEGGSAGVTAGAGAAGDSSSTGGTSSDAGSGPGPSEGGAAGQGGGWTGGSGLGGGASFDAGAGPGGTSGGGVGATGGSIGATGGAATGGRGNTGGSAPGGTGGGGGSTGGSTNAGGTATGGAATGGSGLGGADAGTGATASGGNSSGGSTGTTGGGGALATTQVQSGSATVPADSGTVQVAIDSIDSSKAFLVFGTRFDSASPGLSLVSGQISSSQQLTFTRETSRNAPDIPIHYYVAEFPNGVTVQRGSHLMSTTSDTVTLPVSVDLATSFPIITYRNTGSMYSLDDFVRAKLTSSTALSLSVSEISGNGTVEWQVVSFDGATVQSGDVDITTGTEAFSAPLGQPVDPAQTWLLSSYQVSDLGVGASELMMTGRVSSSTELTFERAATAPVSGGLLTYYAVSFDNGATVQSASSALSNLATDTVALGSPVDPTQAIAATGGIYQYGGSTSYTSEPNIGHGTFTLDLGTGVDLSVSRGVDSSDAVVDYYVIEFP
jgi:hypothetical protein